MIASQAYFIKGVDYDLAQASDSCSRQKLRIGYAPSFQRDLPRPSISSS